MIEFKHITHHFKEFEDAILGACLLTKYGFGRTVGLMKTEYFYHDGNGKIYQAMCEMFEKSIPIDILTVTEWIWNKYDERTLEGWDTPYYITKLTNDVVSDAHIEYHCYKVKELWEKRELLKIKFGVKDGMDINPHEEAERINKEISRIVGGVKGSDWVSMDELMFNLVKHQYKMAKGDIKLVTTGFSKLDKVNGGFSGGDLVILAARPSVGKSAMLSSMSLNMAKKGEKVGIVTLEMSNMQIAARLAAIDTNNTFRDVYIDIAKDEEQHKNFYDYVSRNTIHLPIFITDKTGVTVNDIRAKAMQLQHKHGLSVLFIDYLQLMTPSKGNGNRNRENEVADMSKGLKVLAKELDIPVICLAQLNREVTKRDYKKRFPVLSDLRESGSIEQDADVVMFIHRDYAMEFETIPEGYEGAGDSTANDGDLVVRKWRNGEPNLIIKLDFDGAKMNFSERYNSFGKLNELTDMSSWKKINSGNF